MKYLLFAAGKVGLRISEFLRQNNAHVVAIVTSSESDEYAGAIAATKSPTTILTTDLSLDSPEVFGQIQACEPDLGISAWWPRLFSSRILELPKLGVLNFHPSLLPNNRGKHGSFWAIVEGCKFGVTLHFADRGIDSGDIAFQREIPTSWTDTGASLYERALDDIVSLFIDSFPQIDAGRIPRKRQELTQGSFHYAKEIDEASRIQLDELYSGRQLLNIVRARHFPGRGSAWFTDQGKCYEVSITIREREQGHA